MTRHASHLTRRETLLDSNTPSASSDADQLRVQTRNGGGADSLSGGIGAAFDLTHDWYLSHSLTKLGDSHQYPETIQDVGPLDSKASQMSADEEGPVLTKLLRQQADHDRSSLIIQRHIWTGFPVCRGQHLFIPKVCPPLDVPFGKGDEIGAGGFATVFKATNSATGQEFARKDIYVANLDSIEYRRFLFDKEITLTQTVRHRHVAKVYASYIHERSNGVTMSMLMEPLATSGSLERLLRNAIKQDHILTLKERAILRAAPGCLASAVKCIHEGEPHGMRHKDIKPRNIVIHQGEVLLTDFGIAHVPNPGESLTTNAHTGQNVSARYAPPECFRPVKPRNRKSDVFSLAATWHEIFCALGYSNFEYNTTNYAEQAPVIRRALVCARVDCLDGDMDSMLKLLHDMLHPDRDCRPDMAQVTKRLPATWYCSDCCNGLLGTGIQYDEGHNRWPWNERFEDVEAGWAERATWAK